MSAGISPLRLALSIVNTSSPHGCKTGSVLRSGQAEGSLQAMFDGVVAPSSLGENKFLQLFCKKTCARCQISAIIAFFAAHDDKQVGKQTSEKFFKN